MRSDDIDVTSPAGAGAAAGEFEKTRACGTQGQGGRGACGCGRDAACGVALGGPLDRRSLLRGAVAVGALALVAPLSGCSSVLDVLGIEDPAAVDSQDEGEEPTETVAGSVDFDGLTFTLNLDRTTWSWSQYSNSSSANNGLLVVALPVTVTNNEESSRVLNSLYCKITAPDGTTQPDISSYYSSDDILQRGSITSGSTVTAVIHVLYRGEGAYVFSFDNLLGRKAELAVELGGAETSGLHPIPDALDSGDAATAVPYGESFDVIGLTLTFSSDEASYVWEEAWDESNQIWNGRWCVGVPLTVANYSSTEHTLTADLYGLYSPLLYKLDDPAPWFSSRSLAYVGAVQPGQTVQTMLWWPLAEDGTYYVVFDNAGQRVVASVHFVNA